MTINCDMGADGNGFVASVWRDIVNVPGYVKVCPNGVHIWLFDTSYQGPDCDIPTLLPLVDATSPLLVYINDNVDKYAWCTVNGLIGLRDLLDLLGL